MRFVIFIEVNIAEKYNEEGSAVDRIGSKSEPRRKWDGDGYEDGCDSKEEAKIMKKAGD